MRATLSKWVVPVAILVLAGFAQASERERENLRCRNGPTRFAEIKKKAEANSPEAQTILASCYDLGRNVAPDRKKNIHWLTLAANQGYAPAEFQLGHIYLYGSGIPSDYQQALVWEKKAAEQGEPEAQRDLAFMYEEGFGVRADPREASFWNRKSAQQGERTAQLQLAKALETTNREEAMEWYRRAARQGLPDAQLKLARMYFEKSDRNCRAALTWYERAAESGLAQAMYELGRIYRSEECGRHDFAKAYVWSLTGARYGSPEALVEADRLAPGFSESQKKGFALKIDAWARKHTGADSHEDDEEKDER
jgi:TPR repeat protein